jgi:hypothetical protein
MSLDTRRSPAAVSSATRGIFDFPLPPQNKIPSPDESPLATGFFKPKGGIFQPARQPTSRRHVAHSCTALPPPRWRIEHRCEPLIRAATFPNRGVGFLCSSADRRAPSLRRLFVKRIIIIWKF